MLTSSEYSFLPNYMLCSCSVAHSCPTLRDPMDCSPTGSYVHGILQARILKWVAISSFKGSSLPRNQSYISCIGGQILYHCDTWEVPWTEEVGGLQSMGSQTVRHNLTAKQQPQQLTDHRLNKHVLNPHTECVCL